MADNISLRITANNVDKVQGDLKFKKRKILTAFGIKWQSMVTPLVPVKTGALRQSMTYELKGDILIVGSAKEYAPKINNGFKGYKGKKFLERTTAQKSAVYEKIAEKIFKE